MSKRFIVLTLIFLLSLASASAEAIDIEILEELDLRTAARIALEKNPSLAAAAARVAQAREQVAQARARYWPTVDAEGAGARVDLSRNDYEESLAMARLFDPSATIDDPQNRYRAALTANWVLFDGFERKFANLSARYGEQRTEAARSDAQRLLLSAVASAYFQAQLSNEDIAIARADEAFNERQLVEAKARRRLGTGSLSDELNFQVRTNSAKTSRIQAEVAYETNRIALAALLGLPGGAFPEHVLLAPLAEETAEEMSPPEPEPLVKLARGQRPDLAEADLALKQAEADIRRAQARFYPTVNLTGTVEGDRDEDLQYEGDDFGSVVSLNLKYNLFSGGGDSARHREARARTQEAEKILEERVLEVSSEVRTSAARVASAQRQVALQRENAALVRRTRDLVEKEYNAGQASLVRLNEAQRDLTSALSRLALARAALRQSWFNLETDTGRILDVLQ
ncbi:MAG: TolC family protein [Desulfobacterales bacterium]|nr:TolC family protein [Desulfobacterales bacterium]